jgi:hypothetical protein
MIPGWLRKPHTDFTALQHGLTLHLHWCWLAGFARLSGAGTWTWAENFAPLSLSLLRLSAGLYKSPLVQTARA